MPTTETIERWAGMYFSPEDEKFMVEEDARMAVHDLVALEGKTKASLLLSAYLEAENEQ